jgi:hypothetical protein
MVLQHPKDNKKLGKMHFLPYVSEDPLDDGDLHNWWWRIIVSKHNIPIL